MAKKAKDPEIEIRAKVNGAKEWKEWHKSMGNKMYTHDSVGMLYFVGFIGALIYWVQAAVGFGAVVTGLLKAAVWPAYIVYKLLESFYGVAL